MSAHIIHEGLKLCREEIEDRRPPPGPPPLPFLDPWMWSGQGTRGPEGVNGLANIGSNGRMLSYINDRHTSYIQMVFF